MMGQSRTSRHGTSSGYTSGCRCEACREAWRVYHYERGYNERHRDRIQEASGTRLCECGCGTVIPAINRQGKPARFAHGHGRWVS